MLSTNLNSFLVSNNTLELNLKTWKIQCRTHWQASTVSKKTHKNVISVVYPIAFASIVIGLSLTSILTYKRAAPPLPGICLLIHACTHSLKQRLSKLLTRMHARTLSLSSLSYLKFKRKNLLLYTKTRILHLVRSNTHKILSTWVMHVLWAIGSSKTTWSNRRSCGRIEPAGGPSSWLTRRTFKFLSWTSAIFASNLRHRV